MLIAQRVLFTAFILLLVPAVMAGCSGELSGRPQGGGEQAVGSRVRATDRPSVRGPELQLAAVLEETASAGLPQLASPRDMLAQDDRAVSFTMADGMRDAADYSEQLPSNRVSPTGTNLTFQPNFSSGNSGLERMAYAVYSFDLPDYGGRYVELTSTWAAAPAAGLGYVALGNFATGRWDWYADPSSEALHFDDFNPYIDAGTDTCLVVVAARGTAICQLEMLQIYTPQPPVAALGSDVDSGLTPLDVFFDGSGSVDFDGSVTGYEWDLDGDGTFGESGEEANAAGQSTVSKQFADPGAVTVSLRVTDNDGLTGTDSLIINANLAPNDQPIALLDADPLSGPAPLEVSFDASGSSDPDGSIVAWEWDFDGDGTFGEADNGEQAAADNPQPAAVSYADPGEYNPVVRITDNGGAMDSASVTVSVQQAGAVTAVLESDFSEGDAPLSINFDGSNSLGAITDYEWDFDGDGVFNETGAEATAQGSATPGEYLYSTPGIYQASLRVSDALANSDTATLDITAHGWVNVELPESGVYPSVAVINGHPAVCYHNQDSALNLHTCRYSYSTGLYGSSLSDWSDPVSIEPSVSSSGWQSSLLEVGGVPAVAYFSTATGIIYYERALSATGILPEHWNNTSVQIDSGSQTYWGLKAAIINGNPAVAYYRNTGGSSGELRYARSINAEGLTAGDWSNVITIESAQDHDIGQHCCLTTVDGTPAISYGHNGGGLNRLKYAHSSTPMGISPGDWVRVTISTNEAVDDTVLLTIAGNPAIVYSTPGNGQLKFRRASTVSGNLDTDWTGGVFVTLPPSGFLGSGLGAGIVNGHPAVMLRRSTSPGEIRYLEATSADGALSADWTGGINEIADQAEPYTGEWMEMAVLPGGQPCVIGRGRFVSPTEFGVRYSVKF